MFGVEGLKSDTKKENLSRGGKGFGWWFQANSLASTLRPVKPETGDPGIARQTDQESNSPTGGRSSTGVSPGSPSCGTPISSSSQRPRSTSWHRSLQNGGTCDSSRGNRLLQVGQTSHGDCGLKGFTAVRLNLDSWCTEIHPPSASNRSRICSWTSVVARTTSTRRMAKYRIVPEPP